MQMARPYRQLFLIVRLTDWSALHRVANLRKNPRVSLRRTPDRNAVTAGFLPHAERILPAENITIADNGDAYPLFKTGNRFPIRMPFIKLAACAGMQGNHLRAALLCKLTEQQIRLAACFKTQPHLDRHRHMGRLCDGCNQLRRADRLFHQCTAFPIADDFRHRGIPY